MVLRERWQFSTFQQTVNKHIYCRNSPECSLTLPGRQFCGLTDTGAVEGHHCQRVIRSTLQRTDPQYRLRGVVGRLMEAVWDYSHVAHCCSWGIPAQGQHMGLTVQVKIHARPTRNWYEREDVRNSFPKIWHWHERGSDMLLPDSI